MRMSMIRIPKNKHLPFVADLAFHQMKKRIIHSFLNETIGYYEINYQCVLHHISMIQLCIPNFISPDIAGTISKVSNFWNSIHHQEVFRLSYQMIIFSHLQIMMTNT